MRTGTRCQSLNFYPRPPRGGRRVRPVLSLYVLSIFLPTPSARRATAVHPPSADHRLISTHALREEGDLVVVVDEVGLFGISTHALREEGDM